VLEMEVADSSITLSPTYLPKYMALHHRRPKLNIHSCENFNLAIETLIVMGIFLNLLT